MILQQSKKTNGNYVGLVDIGSASITVSVLNNTNLDIIWTQQEFMSGKKIADVNYRNSPLTALVNAVLILGNDGIKTLKTFDSEGTLRTLQFSLSAPWSYTITKKINIKKETEFIVTNKLIREIGKSIENKTESEITESDIANSLDLSIVTRAITEIKANDYRVDDIEKKTVKSLSMTVTSTVIQDYLYETINDIQQKVFPNIQKQIHSTILQLYYVLLKIRPDMKEYTLVNMTLEVTEIGVIREGILTFTTHSKFGIGTIARDISQKIGLPIGEIYSSMQSNSWSGYYLNLSNTNQKIVDDILNDYTVKLHDLFNQTGDSFTLSKSLYVHSTGKTFSTISKAIDNAAEKTTGLKHIIHNLDRIIENKDNNSLHNTTIQNLTGFFFHTYNKNPRFIHL